MTPRGCNQWVARIHIRVRSTRSPAAVPKIEMELDVGTNFLRFAPGYESGPPLLPSYPSTLIPFYPHTLANL